MKNKIPECDLWLVLGAGGVGKTTTSASLALQMAQEGKRVALITVDPAKRLAQVLGLEALSCIPVEVYKGVDGGTCHALSLDPESFLKDFLNRYTQNAAVVNKIINNRMFQIVRTQLGGIEEYLGIEKIVSLARSGQYDVCVLDTPPSRHAIDFLEAPAHILRFFDERILKFFIQEEAEKADRGFSGFLKKVLSLNRAVDLFKSFLGPGFLNELSDLLLVIKPIYEIFVDTSETIHEWVRSKHVKFICVSVLEKTPMQEVRNLCHELAEHKLPAPTLLVLNKTLPESPPPPMSAISQVLGNEAAENLISLHRIQESERSSCLVDPLFTNMKIKNIPRMNLSTLTREDLLEMGRKALAP